MQENQKLTVTYSELVGVVQKMLLNCIQQPQTYLAVFIMNSDGSATLDFIQNIEYKFIELLSLPFCQSE